MVRQSGRRTKQKPHGVTRGAFSFSLKPECSLLTRMLDFTDTLTLLCRLTRVKENARETSRRRNAARQTPGKTGDPLRYGGPGPAPAVDRGGERDLPRRRGVGGTAGA